MPMVESFVSLDMGDVSYIEKNPDKKEAILFVHGNSSSKEVFQSQLQDDQLQGYRLIALDLFGHGNSGSWKDEKYTLANFSKQIIEFSKKLNLEAFYLVGHSLGGHICIRVAKALRDNLEGLVIFGAPPLESIEDFPRGFLPHPCAATFFNPSPSEDEITNLVSNLTENAEFDGFSDIKKSFINTDPKVRMDLSLEITNLDIDEKKVLCELPFKTLIINCTKDIFINSKYIQNFVPRNFVITPLPQMNTGHIPQLESPKTLASYILEYVSN